MNSRVEALASPIRSILEQVAPLIKRPELYVTIFSPRRSGLGFDPRKDSFQLRAARALLGEWLVGRSIGALDGGASLLEAEEWFYQDTPLPHLAPNILPPPLSHLSADESFALLPYVLDALRQGTRREVMRDASATSHRHLRKKLGAFYTPADVAEFMTQAVGLTAGDTCLDPTCGTGVFLRHAVMNGVEPTDCFGCDIDPAIADAATFSVLAAGLRQGGDWPSPWAAWQAIRSNIATIDALSLRVEPASAGTHQQASELTRINDDLLEGRIPPGVVDGSASPVLGELFPELRNGADTVLMNPPYAPIRIASVGHLADDFESLGTGRASSTTRAEALLVEHVWRLTRDSAGRGALVLPLSIGTSSKREFVNLRSAMQRKGGGWTFSFFDRTPDALFGDDVKTRNAIVTYDSRVPSRVETTRLSRWTSRTRTSFLANLSSTLVICDISDHIPKVGSPTEARLYQALRNLTGYLRDDVVATRSVLPQTAAVSGTSIWVAPTAYNWIGLVRDASQLLTHGHNSDSRLLEISFKDEEAADAAYALLSCNLVYWLWRVESDGFHVTRQNIDLLPFHLGTTDAVPELARLGRHLWESALENVTRSVNKAKVTISFPTHNLPFLDSVDSTIAKAFFLEDALDGCDVRAWRQNLIVVDFTEVRRRRSVLPSQGDRVASGHR